MNGPLRFHPSVFDDLDTAARYYDGQSAGLGDKFLAAAQRAYDRIESNPWMYAVVKQGVRCAPVKRFPYIVAYRIDLDCVYIVSVENARRARPSWRRRI